MIYSNRLLKKQTIFEPLGLAGGVHVLQNTIAAKKLLNYKKKGGRKLGKEIVNYVNNGNKITNRLKSFKNGIENTLMPEKGILKDHVSEFLHELPNLSYSERAVLYNLGKGNFNRVLNSPVIENLQM